MFHRQTRAFIVLILNLINCLEVYQAQDEIPLPSADFFPDINTCILPADLGYAGTEKLLEDCESLDRFNKYPPILHTHFGSSVVICCPESKHIIVFPIDDYIDYEQEYEDLEDVGAEALFTERPIAAKCKRNENCLPARNCFSLDGENSTPPQICGWDSASNNYEVCCENESPRIDTRTTSLNKYECEDFVPECKTLVQKFPSSCSNYSHFSFDFMVKACMKSCGICGDRGCVDEFDRCKNWAKSGHCVNSPSFMAINCRASCGICGFLSIRNEEEQLVNGRQYSSLENSQFFCGRFKPKNSSDLQTEESTTQINGDTDDFDDIIKDIFSRRRKRDLPELKDTGEFFYYQTEAENSNRNIICASTIVSDRFIVSAAHCYINFQGGALSKINSVILRDGTLHTEQVEMRRIFIYPLFQLPSLYDDIAVIELGRRVRFDYDTFGDSPGCLGNESESLVGKEATSQGYGFTEDKVTSNILLESVNNIIDNGECADILSHNSSRHINYKTRLRRALSSGINDQLLCTMGNRNESTGVFAGPCEGDSGGPLYVEKDDINSLVGIVSGGLGCGLNIPKWYTRISSYLPWIKCIIRNAKKYKSKNRVEYFCRQFLKTFPSKNILYQ